MEEYCVVTKLVLQREIAKVEKKTVNIFFDDYTFEHGKVLVYNNYINSRFKLLLLNQWI